MISKLHTTRIRNNKKNRKITFILSIKIGKPEKESFVLENIIFMCLSRIIFFICILTFSISYILFDMIFGSQEKLFFLGIVLNLYNII